MQNLHIINCSRQRDTATYESGKDFIRMCVEHLCTAQCNQKLVCNERYLQRLLVEQVASASAVEHDLVGRLEYAPNIQTYRPY